MSRRMIAWIAVFVTATVIGVVLVVFQPQKLVIDERVDDAVPIAVAPTTAAAPTAATAPTSAAATTATVRERRGEFRSLDHAGSGTARLVKAGDRYVVRFEDLNVENGPDLRVYLSRAPGDAQESAFDDEYVNLGRLRGNQGNQNYPIPADVDVTLYKSVVVWCQRFSSGFAVAPLA